jgi:DNA-binding transcriptional LysR family regulator
LEALAAVQGIGAALLSPELFSQFIAQGKLVAPFASTVEGPSSYWRVWSKDCADAHFLNWIKSQFGVA